MASWQYRQSRATCAQRVWCALAWIVVLVIGQAAHAQNGDAPAWSAMRVFVNENEVESVVSDNYVPVLITELERLLAEDARRRLQSTSQATGIQRAVYVTRFSDQQLSSKASLWQVAMPMANTPLAIDRVSVALEEPQGLSESMVPLSRDLRYVDEQRLQLSGAEGLQNYWFGFKVKTKRRDMGQQSVELSLPKAVLATLVIAVPAQFTVTSSLPCVPLADLKSVLPEQWPTNSLPALQPDERWFAVWLSGRESCSLNFVPQEKASQVPYRLALASSQCDTIVTPAGLQVNSRYQLARAPTDGKLRLRIEQPLHIRSIFVNNIESRKWKTLPPEPALVDSTAASTENNRAGQVVELPIEVPPDTSVVVAVETIGRIAFPFEGVLPRIDVADAYVLDGRCTLSSKEHIEIEDAQCQAHVLSNSDQAGSLSWQWQWTGGAPPMRVRLRSQDNPWVVDALSRINLQNDLVVASVHANVSSRAVQGNQVSMRLAGGWFVDSVDLEKAPLGVSANVLDLSDGTSELNIRWEERRQDLDARIVLKAHYHQPTDVDSLQLPATRILSLPGAQQFDTCVIESSGQFRLDVDPELLRLRAREDDLQAWQRDLLPRLGEAWIFRGGRSSLPPIRLARTKATMETRLHTTVTQTANEVTATYHIVCQPISGSIKQVRIAMPLPAHLPAPTWSLVPPLSGPLPSGLSAISSALSSSRGDTNFTVDLTKEVSEPFQLQAELRLSDTNHRGNDRQLILPLPIVPQAVSQDAVLVLPTSMSLPENLATLEVLPAGMCCRDGLIASTNMPAESDVVAARYDASAINQVALSLSTAGQSKGWIRRAVHEHWQHSAGRLVHRSNWTLATPHWQVLNLRLPVTWELQALLIDGRRIESLQTSRTDSDSAMNVMATVPAGQHVQLELQATSRSLTSWPASTDFDQPLLDLPAMEQRHLVWYPPNIWAGQLWLDSDRLTDIRWADDRHDWADRFDLRGWWQLLSLQAMEQFSGTAGRETDQETDNTQAQQALPTDSLSITGNWWPLELSRHADHARVWSIDRTLAASLMMCVYLLSAMMWLLVCRHSLRWWSLAYLVLGAGLCLVPGGLVWPVQLLILSLISASLVTLTGWLIAKARQPLRRSDSVQISTGALTRLSMWPLAVGLGLTCSHGWAQPPRSAAREVFGIVIPLDADKKIAGEYVYISPRLDELLNSPKSSDSQAAPVSISAAFYSLTVSNNPVSLANEVGDLTVELTVQANRSDAELRLPFLKSELMLQRAFLDSQIMTVGDRIRQENDHIVWKSQGSERHTLRMFLRPRMATQRDGRGFLTVAIPPIPMARLDVLGDDLRDVNVDAIGGMQLESPRVITARLGPVSRLAINWPLNATRSTPQVQSDTWIHSRGDKIMAQCQLRVRGAASLTKQLLVQGDANWTPIGYDWNDARLLTTEQPGTAGRPIYSLERNEDSNNEMVIRVLMLPREGLSGPSLSIPFLSLQPSNASTTRSLALSHTDSPQWKVVGTDAWQPLLASQALQIWDKSRLAEQPTIWKAPNATSQLSMQRTPTGNLPAVDEVTQINLHLPETAVKFVAKWQTPLVGVSAVRLDIPSYLRVDGVYVDSLPARYSVHGQRESTQQVAQLATDTEAASSSTNELVVFVDSSLGGMHTLSLQFSAPTPLEQPFPVPRPILKEHEVASSTVQLFRGAELASAVEQAEGSELQLKKLEVRPSQLLQELHMPMGQLELGASHRQSAELPFALRLTRNSTAPSVKAVMRLNRTDQGWRTQLDALVDMQPGQVNPVFFDIPRSLGDPLEANVPLMLWPSADNNRVIVCALPAENGSGPVHASFAFRLPATGASQAITIPDIRMLGLSTQRPVVALPTVVAGQPVRWTQVGRALPANWLEQAGLNLIDIQVVNFDSPILAIGENSPTSYTLHETGGSQSQATWQTIDDQQQSARLLLTSVILQPATRQSASGLERASIHCRGEIQWWIEPHNRAYLNIAWPQQLQLVGIEANDRPINWNRTRDENIQVMLQPSYLPLRLRAFVAWDDIDAQASSGQCDLPMPIPEASSAGPAFVGQYKRQPGTGRAAVDNWQVVSGSSVSTEALDTAWGQTWASMLMESAPTAADRGLDELAAWLPGWEPNAIGLTPTTTISTKSQFVDGTGEPATNQNNSDLQMSVAEFWERFNQREAIEDRLASTDSPVSSQGSSLRLSPSHDEFIWARVDSVDAPDVLSLQLSSSAHAAQPVMAWAGALGWIVVCLLIMRVLTARTSRLVGYLAEMVWPIWVILAVAAAVCLPTIWPSLVIGLAALIVLLKRYKQLGAQGNYWLLPKVFG